MEDLPITAPEPEEQSGPIVDPDDEPIPPAETPIEAKQRESRNRQRRKRNGWHEKRKHILAERREAAAEALIPKAGPLYNLNCTANLPEKGGVRNGKIQRTNAEIIRRFLEDSRRKSIDGEGRTRLIRMIENMFNIATSARSALSVQAFNALMDRAYGKAKPSEEELGAIKDGGFKLIYVQPPEISPEQIEQFKELPAPKPDFIEGEIVEEGEDGRN